MRKSGKCYKVVNKSTGRVHAKCTSRKRAESQLRLLRGIEHGWKPTGSRKSRKSAKHSRKARGSRKSRKSAKHSRKARGSRKSRKSAKHSRKARGSRKSRKSAKHSRKARGSSKSRKSTKHSRGSRKSAKHRKMKSMEPRIIKRSEPLSKDEMNELGLEYDGFDVEIRTGKYTYFYFKKPTVSSSKSRKSAKHSRKGRSSRKNGKYRPICQPGWHRDVRSGICVRGSKHSRKSGKHSFNLNKELDKLGHNMRDYGNSIFKSVTGEERDFNEVYPDNRYRPNKEITMERLLTNKKNPKTFSTSQKQQLQNIGHASSLSLAEQRSTVSLGSRHDTKKR